MRNYESGMKTLGEVITAFATCIVPKNVFCKECGFGDRCRITDHALYYLQEYREMKEHLACMDSGEIRGDATQIIDNPALSWDELKQMEGKPVWVEERYRNGDLKSSGWWLIDFWNDDQICLRDQGGNPWNEHRSNYGRDWQAYRKEKKG